MATAVKERPGAATTETKNQSPRGNERRGTGWRDAATGKFVPKEKALDTLSA